MLISFLIGFFACMFSNCIIGVAGLLIIQFLYWKNIQRFVVLILISGLGFGFAYYSIQSHKQICHINFPIKALVTGVIVDYYSDTSFKLKVEEPTLGYLKLNDYKNTFKFQVGDKVKIEGRFKRPISFLNAGVFDVEKYFFAEGIAGSIVPSKVTKLGVVDNWRIKIRKLRKHVVNEIVNKIPSSLINIGLIKGIIFGDKRGISTETAELFASTGTSHLLAISGLHIGLAYLCLFKLGTIFWRPFYQYVNKNDFAAIFGLVASFCYAWLAGMSTPTLRAMLMLFIHTISNLCRVKLFKWDFFCLSMCLVILLDPFSALSVGFWLSFIAVMLFLFALGNLSSAAGYFNKHIRPNLVAYFGLAPLTIFIFKQFSVVAFVGNLIAIPLVTALILPMCMLGVVLTYFDINIVLLIVDKLFSLLNTILELLQQLPFSSVSIFFNDWRSWLSLTLLSCSILIPKGLGLGYLRGIFLIPLIFYLQQHWHRADDASFTTTFLDVGQGTAVLVSTKNHHVLYDAGGRYSNYQDAGNMIIVPYLKRNNIRKLDKFIISHFDLDHYGGADSVLTQVSTLELISNQDIIQHKNIPLSSVCEVGTEWSFDGVTFKFLHPKNREWEKHQGNKNSNSCVLKITDGRNSVLLTGDIDKDAEALIVRQFDDFNVDVLLAPHHGSNTSSSELFIQSLQPKIAIINYGLDNNYGHPHPSVIGRYEEYGVSMWSTALNGAVTVNFFLDKELEINSFRGDRENFYWLWGRN